jgi:hypothetical protein
MQKHLSRRELARRVEQGRSAMRTLAAAVVEAGGMLRISRNTFESLPVGHRLTVNREALTGDLILRAGVLGPEIREMTFEEIRAKYAAGRAPVHDGDGTVPVASQTPTRDEDAHEAGGEVRHPDDRLVEELAGGSRPGPGTSDPPVRIQ